MGEPSDKPSQQLNVLGLPIELCCQDPVTGFFERALPHRAPRSWVHTVCALMTEEFLTFSVAAGNDLVHPCHSMGSPIKRWRSLVPVCHAMASAHEAGHAPRLYLRSTHQKLCRCAAGRTETICSGSS